MVRGGTLMNLNPAELTGRHHFSSLLLLEAVFYSLISLLCKPQLFFHSFFPFFSLGFSFTSLIHLADLTSPTTLSTQLRPGWLCALPSLWSWTLYKLIWWQSCSHYYRSLYFILPAQHWSLRCFIWFCLLIPPQHQAASYKEGSNNTTRCFMDPTPKTCLKGGFATHCTHSP